MFNKTELSSGPPVGVPEKPPTEHKPQSTPVKKYTVEGTIVTPNGRDKVRTNVTAPCRSKAKSLFRCKTDQPIVRGSLRVL